MHLAPLVHDLALILITSGLVSLIFRWLKQPIVLGYLLAGILCGPYVTIVPTVADTANLKIWAELGVIFLLFVLGLEFNLRRLFEVGRVALIAATLEVILMTGIGYGVGRLLEWSSVDSLFLGAMLSISSTTIIIKAFEEQNLKSRSFAKLVFGILVIEDLFAVLLLAILSTIAATNSSVGSEVLKQGVILLGFIIAAIPVGLLVIPRLLKLAERQFNDETRVTVSLGLCLCLVVASVQVGFTPALGAFLMGAFMGETLEGEKIQKLLLPIRDLFGAIFFTSVGMLVDIHALSSSAMTLLILIAVTVIGKVLVTTFGARIAGQDRKTAFQAGLSLGQIGEFSFIIATLGMSLGVVRADLYPLGVSVAIATTFLTPYLIRVAARREF